MQSSFSNSVTTKTAVVIGATGLVGKALVAMLTTSPHYSKIVTITRRQVDYDNDRVENHVVDFAQLAEHSELFHGDVLFSCLGTTLKQAGSVAAQWIIDYDYQVAAATLACSNGIPHYLLVSSSGANCASRSSYLKMKGELDNAVKAMTFERISIVKPSLLLGDRDQTRLGENLASVILPTLCRLPGLKRYRPIKGEQVAERLLQLSIAQGTGIEELMLDEVFPQATGADGD